MLNVMGLRMGEGEEGEGGVKGSDGLGSTEDMERVTKLM